MKARQYLCLHFRAGDLLIVTWKVAKRVGIPNICCFVEFLCLTLNKIWLFMASDWTFNTFLYRHLLLLLMKLARLINFYAFIQDHIGKLCLLRICKLLNFLLWFKLIILTLNLFLFIAFCLFINKINFACKLGSNCCLIVRLVLILSWILAIPRSQRCRCYCS